MSHAKMNDALKLAVMRESVRVESMVKRHAKLTATLRTYRRQRLLVGKRCVRRASHAVAAPTPSPHALALARCSHVGTRRRFSG